MRKCLLALLVALSFCAPAFAQNMGAAKSTVRVLGKFQVDSQAYLIKYKNTTGKILAVDSNGLVYLTTGGAGGSTDTTSLSARIEAALDTASDAKQIALAASYGFTDLDTTKQNNIVLRTVGTSGAATLVHDTLNIPQYSGGGGGSSYTFSTPLSETAGAVSIANAAADGSTKGSAAFTASDFNSTTGVISLDYTNGQAATSSVKGFLTAADFINFSTAYTDRNKWDGGSTGLTAATGRTSLGLGTSAVLNVAASGNAATGEVVKGNDTRLSDSRTPSAHASSHASGGSDPITIAESQVTSLTTDLAAKQGTITVTNTGSTGASTLISNTLNIPNYTSLYSANGTLAGNRTVAGNAKSLTISNLNNLTMLATGEGLITADGNLTIQGAGNPGTAFYLQAGTSGQRDMYIQGGQVNIVAPNTVIGDAATADLTTIISDTTRINTRVSVNTDSAYYRNAAGDMVYGKVNTGAGATGTVTSVSVTSANGVSGSVANSTTTPAITLTLGAITPSSIVASGTIAGSNLSGTNTGDQTNITGNAATVTTNANLTGDVTSVGNATTLATVNSNTGSFGSTTAIPSFTVNGKGLITAASTNAVVAPAGTLTGTTLASGVVTSSLTSVGAIGTGVWNGTAIGDTYISSASNWNSAYTDRLKWDGGSTGLTAATGRTSLGATTVGGNIFTLTNPSAAGYVRTNADNSVTHRTYAQVLSDIGAQAAGSYATFTGVETLTNKDLTSGTNTFPTSLATLTGSQTFTNKTLTAPVISTITNTGTLTLPTSTGTLALVSQITGTNSGTNTGDQTITLTGGVTGSGTGSFAATVVTNANLTGDLTSVGNATTLATVNSNVGTFGTASTTPAITVNGKGLVTGVTTNTVQVSLASGSANITGTLGPGNGGTGITALGTGVATALGVNIGGAGAPVVYNGALGTPSSGTLTNCTIKSELVVAVSDETTAITTGTAKVTFRMPYAMTVTGVRASVNTVSSSGLPTFDIKQNGTTILSTLLTIDASEKTSTTAATAAVVSNTALTDDAEITIDVTVAGTGDKGGKIIIYGTRN